jgi:prolyl 4-hydroxylase
MAWQSSLMSFLLGVIAASFAFSIPRLSSVSSDLLNLPWESPFSHLTSLLFFVSSEDEPHEFDCQPHDYRTQLISLDPLVIYIHDFLTATEINALLTAAEPNFAPSLVNKGHDGNIKIQSTERTSSSAALPVDDPVVECVLARASNFMGTGLRPEWDEIGPPQLVRYGPGQRFDLHHDWFDTPRIAKDGTKRTWNRVASFFAVLQDDCTAGETLFPYIEGIAGANPWANKDQSAIEAKEQPVWREYEDGGLAFRPVKGNAIFWQNLHANGTGDGRVMHAGLPLGQGLKTAMNIWPRQYERA